MIKAGDTVKVEYEGRLESGEIFDSSKHGEHSHPIEFKVGEGQVIPGFEEGVIGMAEGEEKEITITPDKAYGEENPTMKQTIPRSSLPQDQEPKEGMALILTSPTGQQMPVKITEVTDETITIDLNHPLAGKTLIFKIKIIGVNA